MDEIERLRIELIELQNRLREETWQSHNRINPLIEDITDWKERGEFLFGKGKNITIYNTCSIAGNVEVGENTWIGPYSAIDGGGGVTIGSNCSISSGVQIVSHDSVKWALSGGRVPHEYAPIRIGNNCFIGTNAMVTKGVHIGDHCLIGAGAIVTRDLPSHTIALGVPARVVGRVELSENGVDLVYNDH